MKHFSDACLKVAFQTGIMILNRIKPHHPLFQATGGVVSVLSIRGKGIVSADRHSPKSNMVK